MLRYAPRFHGKNPKKIPKKNSNIIFKNKSKKKIQKIFQKKKSKKKIKKSKNFYA
jgi:hypothetical protein